MNNKKYKGVIRSLKWESKRGIKCCPKEIEPHFLSGLMFVGKRFKFLASGGMF